MALSKSEKAQRIRDGLARKREASLKSIVDKGAWHIATSSHGVFLMNGNFCVMRLDNKDPSDLVRE